MQIIKCFLSSLKAVLYNPKRLTRISSRQINMPLKPSVVYEFEQSGHGWLVTVGIGEGIDEEYSATLDEFIIMTVAIYSYSVFHKTGPERMNALFDACIVRSE